MNSKYKNKINEAIKNIEKLEKVQANRKYRYVNVKKCKNIMKHMNVKE